ncbi:hypothetical protein FQR65_LT09319 [Abscondita terminalis]|nr:hypothetical protein FQR65_LT09319 [Abscondita terminalis]
MLFVKSVICLNCINKSYIDRFDEATAVNISATIEDVYFTNILNMEVEVTLLLHQRWFDFSLSNDAKTQEKAVGGQIWRPKITTIKGCLLSCNNNDDTQFWRGYGEEGNVLLSEKLTVKTKCTKNFRKYPFDSQVCELKFGTYRFPEDELKLRWETPSIEIQSSKFLNGFQIINVTTFIEKDLRVSGMFDALIDNILKQLNNFNENDKEAAFTYVKQHFRQDKLSLSTKKRKVRVGSRNSNAKKNKNILKCTICQEVKSTKIQYLKHLEGHIGTPITCRRCRKTFNNDASFQWHLSNLCSYRHKLLTNKYKCSQCPKEFWMQAHLYVHQIGHKRNNCSHCGLVFSKYINLKNHLKEQHNITLQKPSFKCKICTKSYVKRRSLYRHLGCHYKFVCLDCGCVSKTAEEHDNHLVTHKDDKPWKCVKCGDKFSRRQLYFNHLKRHDRYKCLTCKENFASQSHALRHKKHGHVVKGLEPRMYCPYCPSTFFRSLSLQIHLDKHRDKGTTLQCKFCVKSFQTPRQYFKHCLTTTHDENSPDKEFFVCEHCGKQFTKKHVFEKHLHRFHGQQLGPYSCNYCEYKTRFRPNLSRHLKLHFTKQNEYMCDHCGKYFSNVAVLNDHIKYVHKEEKLLHCTKCDKSFKRNSELNRHLHTHSDIRPYCCEMCPNTYKRISHLRRHEENAHGLAKKSNRIKRFLTNDDGRVVPVPVQSKTENLISNSSTTENNLYIQVLNKIPNGFDQVGNGSHYAEPSQEDGKLCTVIGSQVLSIILKANQTGHDAS